MSREFDRQMRRLQNVARAVEEGKGPFDMSEYTTAEGGPSCAFGYYASRRDLQKTFTILNGVLYVGSSQRAMSTPVPHIAYFYDDIASHFGLTGEEARTLFDTDGCNGAGRDRKKAAKFIKNFVAAKIRSRKKK